MRRPPRQCSRIFTASLAAAAFALYVSYAESRSLEKRDFNGFGMPAWMPPQKKESSVPIDENLMALLRNTQISSGDPDWQKQLFSYLLEMQRRGHDVEKIQRKAISSIIASAGNDGNVVSRSLLDGDDSPRVRFLRVY